LQNILSRCIDFIEPWTELVLVIFIAWTLLRVKEKLLLAAGEFVQSTDSATPSFDESQVLRFLQPLSQLLTWAIFIGAAMSSLIILGVDIGPMLAFGGASTLAIGLAAQSTVSNLVAALSLYTSRAFIKGDRVQFKSMSGSTVVAGMVLDIQPMKTLVKTSNGALIYVNNKDLATSLMVVNESLESRTKLSSSIAEITTEVIVRYKDVDKVAGIVRDIEAYLQTHEDLDSILSRGCHVKSMSASGVHLMLTGTMAADARARGRAVYTDIYLSVERIVRQHGAFLGGHKGYDLPPPLKEDA
ncbi:MAG: mechanosensitive ion channel domain-containing protein, partial [bacterium]